MKAKKIIITILGLLLLLGLQFCVNMVVFKGGMESVALAPVFAIVYLVYIHIMSSKYIKLR